MLKYLPRPPVFLPEQICRKHKGHSCKYDEVEFEGMCPIGYRYEVWSGFLMKNYSRGFTSVENLSGS